MTEKTATEKAFDRYAAARWGYPSEVEDVVACIDALHAIVVEQASEIRMLKLRVSELADEQPATVAPDADLHPVARLLAQAYRLASGDEDISSATRSHIRVAFCAIAELSEWSMRDEILHYGVRS